MTVAQLLAASRAAHDAYRQALPRLDQQKQLIPGDSAVAAAALQRAFELRAEAEHADVAGELPTWSDEASTHPHYQLLKFYDLAEQRFPAAIKAEVGPIIGTLPPVEDVKHG